MPPYVPPHMRKKQVSEVKESEPFPKKQGKQPPKFIRKKQSKEPPKFTLVEIHHYFHSVPVQKEEEEEDADQSKLKRIRHTMHDSLETPGELAFVILYKDAQRRWDSDQIIFSKSNLCLLPKSMAGDTWEQVATSPKDCDSGPYDRGHGDDRENNDRVKEEEYMKRPIAVFREGRPVRGRSDRRYLFEGWFTIDCLAFLEPRSAGLGHMLQQKWSKTSADGKTYVEERIGSAWQASFDQRWAVVKFAKDEAADKERRPPQIQRTLGTISSKRNKPNKSVNELLAEMRLKGAGDNLAPNGDRGSAARKAAGGEEGEPAQA